MQVRQVMQRDLISVLPSSTVHEAAQKMKDNQVGTVVVLEEGGKLRGILTDRDIAISVAADSRDPKSTFTCDIMTADPISITSDADVTSALRIMNRARIRRLPVSENGRIVGLLSSADLAHEVKEEFNEFIGLEEAFARSH